MKDKIIKFIYYSIFLLFQDPYIPCDNLSLLIQQSHQVSKILHVYLSIQLFLYPYIHHDTANFSWKDILFNKG